MDARKTELQRAIATGSPVFYRTAVREFLQRRLAKDVDLDRLTDDVLRDVCDPEVIGLFGRNLGGFRQQLLMVTLLRISQVVPRDVNIVKEGGAPRERWLVAPATLPEQDEFDLRYAIAFLAAAAGAFSAALRGKDDRMAEAVRLRYRQRLRIPDVAARMELPADTITAVLQDAKHEFRGHLLGTLRLVCPTEEEALAELKHLTLVLACHAAGEFRPE